MDVLSDVLRAVRLTGAIYFDIDASSPWVGESPGTAEIASRRDARSGAHHFFSRHHSRSFWARAGPVPPVRVDAGDVVVFPGGANVMSSSLGARGEPNMAMYYRPIDREPAIFGIMAVGRRADPVHLRVPWLRCTSLQPAALGVAATAVRPQTRRRQWLGNRTSSASQWQRAVSGGPAAKPSSPSLAS